MKIAIPTNDKEHLFKRSGQTKGFLIINISDNYHNIDDYRINTHSHHHNHSHSRHHDDGHSHKEIVDALSDCDYIVVNVIGKHFNNDLQTAGIKVFKTNETTVLSAVKDFMESISDKK